MSELCVAVDVPALGESISEGSVSSFEKAIGKIVPPTQYESKITFFCVAGDIVDVDDVIAVIETDKVTVRTKDICMAQKHVNISCDSNVT